jgi:D-arginine dehydrogenase
MAVERTRFLVVGGGIAGLSTVWQLAVERGVGDVVLVEGEPHLGMHSTARNAAILRTLSSDSITTRLAAETGRFLHEPPAGFSDVPLVDARGLILAADEGAAEALGADVKALPADVPCEVLSPARLRVLAPAFESKVAAAYFFPRDGQIDIAALVAGFAKGAKRAGAELRRGSRVERLVVEDGRVVGVELESGDEIRAETTILAAGGWAMRIAAAAGSRVVLRPTRRHLMITEPSNAVDRRWPVLWHMARDGEFYCRPDSGGMLLCACDIVDVDPDAEATDPGVRSEIAARASRHLPSLENAGAAHFWCGGRTLTPDGRFAIGSDPDLPGLFWVAGLGGSGMSCSSSLGRVAADLLLGSSADESLARGLAPVRLARPTGSA